jgi:hypothetical protein
LLNYLGAINDKNIINPIICHTERAGFANEKRSTTTSFHNNFPTNPKIIIAKKNASKYEIKSTYAARFSLDPELDVKPSIAALHADDKLILLYYFF